MTKKIIEALDKASKIEKDATGPINESVDDYYPIVAGIGRKARDAVKPVIDKAVKKVVDGYTAVEMGLFNREAVRAKRKVEEDQKK